MEGSICEAYNIEEIAYFTSYYFESSARHRHNHPPRHDDGGEGDSNGLKIFSFPGRSLTRNEHKTRFLKEDEYQIAHNYVLLNCLDIQNLIE